MSPAFTIRHITVADALAVRLDVLRRGTLSQDATYDGDDEPHTAHIGAAIGNRVVATSTWLIRPWQYDTTAMAIQLRGMAVLDEMQNSGVGHALVDAGMTHAHTVGARYVWAKARDSALYFYERCGFHIVDEQCIEPASGMPHHLVLRETVTA
jgi:GNAT superfamily N-acetyltransferase